MNNINLIPNFPATTMKDLERVFDLSISGETRDKINKKERVTPNDLGINKVVVALSMQYRQDGSVDIGFLERELIRLSNEGIKTVLIAGTTGESSLLSADEHITYVRVACDIAKKYGITIVAGAGSNNTAEQNHLIDGVLGGEFEVDKKINEQYLVNVLEIPGSVATLLLPPYYIKTGNENLIRHFVEGLNKGPAIIYSIKGRTGMEIPLEVIEVLSKHSNFLGVKECDGPDRIKYLVDKGITVWTGNDDTITNDVNNIGAYGVISVTANIIPVTVMDIIKEKLTSGSEVTRNLLASNLLFPPGYPNPHMIHSTKSIIEHDGNPVVFRLPVGPVGDAVQDYALRAINALGLEGSRYGDNYRLYPKY